MSLQTFQWTYLHQSWGLLLAVDNGECVHIHCVQSVYSEYKYGEATGRLIRPRDEREERVGI